VRQEAYLQRRRGRKRVKKQLPGQDQTPLVDLNRTTGERSKHREGKSSEPSQPVLTSDCDDQQGPAIPTPQLSQYNESISRPSSRNWATKAWVKATNHIIAGRERQNSTEEFEVQANSTHVVDGIYVRAERSGVDIITDTSCSQSVGYPSTIETLATELSEGWTGGPDVLASVGGQFEESALLQHLPTNRRSSTTVTIGNENKEQAKGYPVIEIIGLDVNSNETASEKNGDGSSTCWTTTKQLEGHASFPLDISEANLDWVEDEIFFTSISQKVLRSSTFPDKTHSREDSVSPSMASRSISG
jgi:hypothetical protein